MRPILKRGQIHKAFERHYQFVQHLWAKKMSKATSGISKPKLLYGLFAFVFFSGSFFVYRIVESFSSNTSVSIKIPSISKVTTGENTNEKILIKVLIKDYQYYKIKSFNEYLDSLSKDTQGKKIYDSIRKGRGGLLDSLTFIENYYNSNFNEYELWKRKHFHLKN